MRTRLLPLPLVLLALLLVAGTGWAAAPPPPAATGEAVELEAEEGEEEETEESASEECETGREELEEGEITTEELEEDCERLRKQVERGDAPEECVLRSAHGHASVDDKHGKLKLTIGYTAYEPTAATIDLGKGPSIHRHLGRSGVIRVVDDLHGASPHRVVVRIDLPSARSAGCPFRRLVLVPR